MTVEGFPHYCDLHTHFLPGVDDGCLSPGETRTCLASVAALGCRRLVCTPHMGVERYPDNTPDEVQRRVRTVQDYANELNLDLEILDGGEFRLIPDAIAWWSEYGVPTLGSGRVVLVDTWSPQWQTCFDDALVWLLEEGYQPMLAHPERMRLEKNRWQEVIERVVDLGVWLQGNFKSFGRHDHPEVGRRARLLLADERYQILASDSHGPASLEARQSGMRALQRELPRQQLQALVWDRPNAILDGCLPADGGNVDGRPNS